MPRILALFMSFAFGVIGMSVGINALVKFEDQKHQLQKLVSSGTTLNIDISDIQSVGIVITIVCGLIALASLLFIVPVLLASASSSRMLGLQTLILAFLSVWCFACLIPLTDFFANHSAKVTAFIGSIQLPQSIIQGVEAQVGATPVYHKVSYRKHRFCIIPVL